MYKNLKTKIKSDLFKASVKIIIGYYAISALIVFLLQEMRLLEKYSTLNDKQSKVVLNYILTLILVIFLRIFLQAYIKITGKKIRVTIVAWNIFATIILLIGVIIFVSFGIIGQM